MRLTNVHVKVDAANMRISTSRMGFAQCLKVLIYVQRVAVINASRGRYTTGLLAGSITRLGPFVMPTTNDGGTRTIGFIYSPLHYAASVEFGAEIHSIFPKGAPHVYRFGSRARPMLAFTWRGRRVITPHVPMSPGTIGTSHPGQRGKRYLTKALARAAVRYQMRFTPGLGNFR